MLATFTLLCCISTQLNAQVIYTVAGTGLTGSSGDGGAATSAKLDNPNGIAFDAYGNMYIADTALHTVRKVDVTTGIISIFAGTSGSAGSSGDGSAATSATLNAPIGLVFDASGNLYISEASGNVIRKVNTSGVISTIAGTGTASSTGDGSSATSATLDMPAGLVFDASGNLYISELNGNRVRKINTSGVISTVVGTGVGSSTGDGGAATSATVDAPMGLAFDATGNLYIAEAQRHKIRKVNTSGDISTYVGTGTAGSTGDGGLATAATIKNPAGIVFDASGNLFIAESNGRFVRMVDASGMISTIAGTGTAGYTGDGGNPTLATFRRPFGLAISGGNLFISDWNTHTVRMICTPVAPTVTATATYCEGVTATALTANGTNLKWYTDATSTTPLSSAPIPSTSAAGTTTYYVSQTSFEPLCESPRAAITVTVNPEPADPTVSSPITYCKDATASVLSATGTNLKWYTVATGGTGSATAPTPSTATATTLNYYVSQTSIPADGGCEGSRANIQVIVNPLPAAPIVTSTVGICVGGVTTALTATGTDLKWYTVSSGGTASATAPTPSSATAGTTNYYVTQTSDAAAGSCEGPMATITVNINEFPAAPGVTTPLQLCKDAVSTALTATGTNLKWYDLSTGGTEYGSAPVPATTTLGTTTYYVSQSLSAIDGGCESPRIAIDVTVNDVPVAPTVASSLLTYCKDATAAVLSATGTDLKWYTVATGGTGSSTAPTPSTTTATTLDYYVAQTSLPAVGACEGSRANIQVVINPLPTAPTVTSPIAICVGGATTALTATGTDLKWYTVSTGGTSSTTAPTPSSATSGTTNYYVSQTSSVAAGACEGPRATIAVNINAYPDAPTVPSAIQLCKDGSSSTLTATGSNLKWYDVSTGGTALSSAPTPVTSAVGTTSYYVSQSLAASAGGCEGARATIDVTVNALPAPPTVTTPINLCVKGSSSALTATGTSLKWYTASTGGTGSIVAPTPSTATVGGTFYYVSQTSAASVGSCEGTRATIDVQVQPLPIVSVASTATSGIIFCEGKTIRLQATAPTATSYQWQSLGTPVSGATSDKFDVGVTGLSGVEVTDVYGCKASAEMFVQQDTSAKPNLTPSEVSICVNSSTLLTCHPGFLTYTFNWIKDGSPLLPATLKENIKVIDLPGDYYVEVTNNFGCIDTTTISVVTQYPIPVKPIISFSDPVAQIPSIYKYYQWYRNGTIIPGAAGYKRNITSNGKYHVEVTDENGCTTLSDTLIVNKPTSISNLVNKSDLKIYPNPTNNIVHIEAPAAIAVRVSNIFGQVVLEEKNVKTIDLTNAADGTYFLQITDENDQLISVEKITKASN